MEATEGKRGKKEEEGEVPRIILQGPYRRGLVIGTPCVPRQLRCHDERALPS